MATMAGAAAIAAFAFVGSALPATAAAKKPSNKAAKSGPEVSPAGDIPDNQAFVPYTPSTGGFVVSVPEGWARTESGSATSFTDKLNTIRMQALPVKAAPTTKSVLTTELPAVRTAEPKVTGGTVSSVKRKSGAVLVLKYQRDSGPNVVTGKVIREAVERYEFWRSGSEVVLTLSGPVGADNVDPWKIVTESFGWK